MVMVASLQNLQKKRPNSRDSSDSQMNHQRTSMNSQGLLGKEDLQLIEISQEVLLELSEEPCTALTAEIEHGHDDHLIKIEPCLPLPNAPEREIALVRRQATEPSHKPSLDGIERCVGDRTVGIIG